MTDLSKLSVDELLNELQRSALAGEWVAFGMAKSQLSTNASSRAARITELEKERDEARERTKALARDIDEAGVEIETLEDRVVVLENALRERDERERLDRAAFNVSFNLLRGGVGLIAHERIRQVEAEGYTDDHDDDNGDSGQLATAAAVYALGSDDEIKIPWPWCGEPKFTPGDRRRELVKAGALIVAEIDRLARAALSSSLDYDPMESPSAPAAEEEPHEGLTIIGRERALANALTELLHDKVKSHHDFGPIIETSRGTNFDVRLLVDGQDSGRVARVTVDVLAPSAEGEGT